MTDIGRIAAERIKRFERLGGVRLDTRELLDPLAARVRSGVAEYKKAYFAYRCPVCGHALTSNQEMEPMCTGPSWTNDHPPTVMDRVMTDDLKLALKGR